MDVRSLDFPMFDYQKQVWVLAGKYEDCAHPKTMQCFCYGRTHAGQLIDAKTAEHLESELADMGA